jgi:predicted nucleic acid-binding protein
MILFTNYFFKRYYKNVSTIFIDQNGKKRVIEMYLQNKTISEIAKKVPMSFRDISQIIKTYQRKKELQAKREENN